MDKFAHDRIIIGMILSLGIAHLLKGVAKLIEHPTRSKPYWIHLLWVGYVFLLLVHFWWWEFRLSHITEWNFLTYFYIISYIVLFYIICSLLFPDDLKEYNGYKDYYYARGKWFFALLALTFLVDIGDGLIKGKEYVTGLGTEYPIRTALHFILCVVAMKVKKEWFHGTLAIVFIVYSVSWILRKYLVQ
jgi:phosphoglycerol transferase MdoB-like AlkP superfamily enzyme